MGCLFSFFRRGTFHPADLNPALKRKKREGDKTEADLKTGTVDSEKVDQEAKAATKIQASYRGYKTRKSLKQAQEEKQKDEEIAAELIYPLKIIRENLEEEAAVKIQSGVRGFLTRRRLENDRKSSSKCTPSDQNTLSQESTDVIRAKSPIVSGEPEHDLAVERILKQYGHSAPVSTEASRSPSVSSECEKSLGAEEVDEVSTAELEAQLSAEKEAESALVLELPEVLGNGRQTPEKVTDSSELARVEEPEESAGAIAEVNVEAEQKALFELSDVKKETDSPNDPENSHESSFSVVEEIIAEAQSVVESLEQNLGSQTESMNLSKDETESESGMSHHNEIIQVEVHRENSANAKSEERPDTGKSSAGSIPSVKEETTEPVVLPNQKTVEPNLQSEEGAVTRRSKRNTSKVQSKYRSGFVEVEPEFIKMNKTPEQNLHHINESDLDDEIEHEVLNNAAAKIQAGFRGFKARQSLSQAKASATKIQAGFRGYKARKKVEQEKKAAVKIQATVRGFLARRRLAKQKLANQLSKRRKSSTGGFRLQRRRSSQLTTAAIRIQSAYRGYAVRKNLKEVRPDSSPSPTGDVVIENVSQ